MSIQPYVQQFQQKFVCQRCGKPVVGALSIYAACQCVSKASKSPKEQRKSLYVQALLNTVRTARTAASLVGSMPNPRLAGARR